MDPMMKWTIKMYQAMMMSKPMFVSMSMRIPPDWLMSVMYPEDLIWSPCTTLSETCLSGGSQCLLVDCFSRPRCFLQWKLLFTVVS